MNDDTIARYLGSDAPYVFAGEAGEAQLAGDGEAFTRLLSTDYVSQHAAIARGWAALGDIPRANDTKFDVLEHAEIGGRRDALVAAEVFLRACVTRPSDPIVDETVAGGVLSPGGALTTLGDSSPAAEPNPVPMPNWAEQNASGGG